MKKKLALIFLVGLFLFPYVVNAKETKVTFNSYGTELLETDPYTILKTSDDNFIVGARGNRNISGSSKNVSLLIKLDKKFNKIWELVIGGTGYIEYIEDVIETKDNNYIIVGHRRLKYNGGGIGFLIKVNENGKIVWEKEYDSSYGIQFSSVVEANDGSLYIVGFGDIREYSGIYTTFNDALLFKYDSEGNFIFKKNYNNTTTQQNTDRFNDIQIFNDKIYVSGSFDNYALGVVGILNLDGTVQWMKTYDPEPEKTNNLIFDKIQVLENGGFIVSEKNLNNHFLFEYSVEGELIKKYYVKDVFNSNGGSVNSGFIRDNKGNIISYGNVYNGQVNGNPYGLNMSGNQYDGIVVQYDNDGNVIDLKNYGGSGYDYFYDIVMYENKYTLVGSFDSTDIEGLENKGLNDIWFVTFETLYNLSIVNSDNGKVSAEQDGLNGIINITPNDGYIIDEIIVKDTKDNVIEVKKSTENKYNFDLFDDVTIEVIFKKVYSIKVNDIENGKATAEQYENGKGRVNAVADEGFELDNIVIKDTTGKEVVYEEKDGYYYFDVNDDLVITVTFKELPKEVVKDEEENPKTADAFIYYACAVVCSLFGIWSVEQYRKTVKE